MTLLKGVVAVLENKKKDYAVRVNICVRLDPELNKQLREYMDKHRKGLSEVVSQALRLFLSHNQNK